MPINLFLGKLDIEVPRSDNFIDGWDGLGAIRHRGNGLRTAAFVDFLDTAFCGGNQHIRVNLPISHWRDTDGDFFNTRNGSGDDAHQQ